MNKHLKQVIDLSGIDKAIDGFLPEEQRINGALTNLQDEQKRAASQIEELEVSIEENHNKIVKNEGHLAELSDKLAMHTKKSGDIKTEKEMKALQLEEEIAREQVAYANEEIARLQKIESARKDEITALKTRINEIDGQIVEARKQSAEALAALEEKKKQFYKQKETLVKEVPQKVLFFYEKIRRWAGNSAVVPVKKQACYGCFMKVSDKIYGEVITSSEIVTCPNCGRILYIENEEAVAPAA